MSEQKVAWGDPEWPRIIVKYYMIRSLPNTALIDYIGDYEMALAMFHGVDLNRPIRDLAKKGYRYFIFNMKKTKCFDHPYGIGQYTWLLQNVVPFGGEFAICGPSRWLEEYFKYIVPIESITSRYFQTLTACQEHIKAAIQLGESGEKKGRIYPA